MKYGITLGYVSKLKELETLKGIEFVNSELKNTLKKEFNLIEVSSAVVADKVVWLNDDSQQTKRIIDFDNKSIEGYGEVLYSNNKWRRHFLYENNLINDDEGIITNFSVIDRDVKVDNTSSISFEELGIEIAKNTYEKSIIEEMLTKIFNTVVEIDKKICDKYKNLENNHFGNSLTFITYKKLKKLYPLISFKERLNSFARDNGTFVIHDYIENTLNQDQLNQFSSDVFDFKTYSRIYYYNKSCEKALSFGYAAYQVDKEILKNQSNILKEKQKAETGYNKLIKSNSLPLTVSCGIYINRLMMGFLEKQHISEVHSTIWNPDFIKYCKKNKIKIL